MKTRYLVLFLIGLLTLSSSRGLFACQDDPDLAQSEIKISPETTFITEPLTHEGLPDYRGCILHQQRARAQRFEGLNGAVPFWQAMWPGSFTEEQQKLLKAELGEEILPAPTGTRAFVDLENKQLCTEIADWLVDHWCKTYDVHEREEVEAVRDVARSSASEILSKTYIYPYSSLDLPPVSDWVRRNLSGYQLLDSAAACQYFYSPSTSLLTQEELPLFRTELKSLDVIRHAHRLIAMRTHLHIGDGDFPAAWESCLSALRLVQISHQNEFLVSQLMSTACMDISLMQIRNLATHDNVPASLLRQMLRDLSCNPPPVNIAHSIDTGERMFFLHTTVLWSQGRSDYLFNDTGQKKMPRPNVDWDALLKRGNQMYEEVLAASRLPFAMRQSQLKSMEKEYSKLGQRTSPGLLGGSFLSRKERTFRVGNILLNMYLPATLQAFDAESRIHTNFELTKVAIALAIYRSEHEKYPDSLNELVPAIMESIPNDHYHGSPLLYRRTSEGFLLYSPGQNGINDQGDMYSYKFLRGFRVMPENLNQLREVLDDEIELGDDLEALFAQIKKDADDIAIRYPLPVPSLPECPIKSAKNR